MRSETVVAENESLLQDSNGGQGHQPGIVLIVSTNCVSSHSYANGIVVTREIPC